MAIAILPQTAAAAEPDVEDPVACMSAVIDRLAMPAQQAIGRIRELPRQILAASMYLQARGIEARWSWSEEQIRIYEVSPEHAAALAAIDRVRKRFEAQNPGYTIQVNTQIRSLDTQIASWNANESVLAVGNLLVEAAIGKCQPKSPNRFVEWLRSWKPVTPPNLAPPGLSPHGQALAFDFQVMSKGIIIAPTDSRRIQTDWIDAGWGPRLAEAMTEARPAFKGPLLSPNEPWHYSYEAKMATLSPSVPTDNGLALSERAQTNSAVSIPRPRPNPLGLYRRK